MSFIDKIIQENKLDLKNFFLEVKIFGWSWSVENVKMNEDFLEEYAESLDWKKVLNFQDYSPIFEDKFRFKFEKDCEIISSSISNQDFRTKIINPDNLSYEIRNLLSSDKLKNDFIGIKIIFTGKNGRKLFEEKKDIKTVEMKDKIFKVYIEFDETYMKNSIILKVDTVKKTAKKTFFIS